MILMILRSIMLFLQLFLAPRVHPMTKMRYDRGRAVIYHPGISVVECQSFALKKNVLSLPQAVVVTVNSIICTWQYLMLFFYSLSLFECECCPAVVSGRQSTGLIFRLLHVVGRTSQGHTGAKVQRSTYFFHVPRLSPIGGVFFIFIAGRVLGFDGFFLPRRLFPVESSVVMK